MRILLACVLTMIPAIGWAAYQNPTVLTNERQPNGFIKITLQFTGNAGESTVRRDFLVRPSTTATQLRNFVDDTINELDNLHTASTIPALQPGQTIPKLARTPVTPTAKQTWRTNYNAYMAVKDADLTNATFVSERTALKTWLDANYQAGFLTE